jgi:HSP20 family protein
MYANNVLTLWNHFLNDPWSSDTPLRPAYDVEEAENHYLLTLEMPGVARDQLRIETVESQLAITGERRGGQKFQRTFTVPSGVDLDRVEAHYQDGILRLYLPKHEKAKPRQIKIATDAGSSGLFRKLLGSEKSEGAA